MIVRVASSDDFKNWNNVADNCSISTYSHTWEWKEVLERGFNIKAHCLVAEENDNIVGIYPSFSRPTQNIFKKHTILESPFEVTWDYGGPCILPEASESAFEQLLIGMEEIALKNGAISIKISPFGIDNKSKNICLSNNYRISPRLTSIIDLNRTNEEIWKSIQKQTKKIITKAEEHGVRVMEMNNEGGLKKLYYECLIDLKSHTGMYLPPYAFFKSILDIMVPKNMATIFIVEYNGTTIGGGLALHYKDMAVLRYAGTVRKFRYLSPHYLLHYHQIMHFKNNNFKIFDQGGIPSQKEHGLYIFKSKWGGQIKNIDWYIKDLKFSHIRKMKRFLFNKIKSIK